MRTHTSFLGQILYEPGHESKKMVAVTNLETIGEDAVYRLKKLNQ